MANPDMNPLFVNQEEEENHPVVDLLEFLSSFAVKSLSDDIIISLDASCSVIPPRRNVAIGDGHVNDDGGGLFRRRMVLLGGGSRYSIGNQINRDGTDADEDEYDDDLDDELIPRSVSKKLKTERLRKLGKRVFSKVRTSTHLKPGCIHGKHGLGIRFRC